MKTKPTKIDKTLRQLVLEDAQRTLAGTRLSPVVAKLVELEREKPAYQETFKALAMRGELDKLIVAALTGPMQSALGREVSEAEQDRLAGIDTLMTMMPKATGARVIKEFRDSIASDGVETLEQINGAKLAKKAAQPRARKATTAEVRATRAQKTRQQKDADDAAAYNIHGEPSFDTKEIWS